MRRPLLTPGELPPAGSGDEPARRRGRTPLRERLQQRVQQVRRQQAVALVVGIIAQPHNLMCAGPICMHWGCDVIRRCTKPTFPVSVCAGTGCRTHISLQPAHVYCMSFEFGRQLTFPTSVQAQDAPHNSWGGQQAVAPPSEPVPDGMLRRRRAANPREKAGQAASDDLSFG
jgi:hypothetical protein